MISNFKRRGNGGYDFHEDVTNPDINILVNIHFHLQYPAKRSEGILQGLVRHTIAKPGHVDPCDRDEERRVGYRKPTLNFGPPRAPEGSEK